VRALIVEEAVYQRMPFERLLHDAALNTFPASMNQTHLSKAECVRFVDVFLDDRRYIARFEGVQIELSLDRDAHSSS